MQINVCIMYIIMPYTLRKVRRRRCYSVKNKQNKRVFAKCTSKAKALRQMKLLRAIKYGKDFKKKLRQTQKMSKTRRKR